MRIRPLNDDELRRGEVVGFETIKERNEVSFVNRYQKRATLNISQTWFHNEILHIINTVVTHYKKPSFKYKTYNLFARFFLLFILSLTSYIFRKGIQVLRLYYDIMRIVFPIEIIFRQKKY